MSEMRNFMKGLQETEIIEGPRLESKIFVLMHQIHQISNVLRLVVGNWKRNVSAQATRVSFVFLAQAPERASIDPVAQLAF
jgi:ABC-type antimicrobial peptide transport system ATPase subunit